MTAALIGVGVGPGDPEHLTLKALRELREADVVFVPSTPRSLGRAGRAEHVVADHVEVQRLAFAMDGTLEQRGASWDAAGARIAEHLARGERVAFCTLGDPNVYSTFAYIAHTVRELVPGVEVRTVPGITAMQDLASRAGVVLTEGTEPLQLVPATAGDDVLRDALADTHGTVVVYKGGGRLPEVPALVTAAGRDGDATFGEHLGTSDESLATPSGRAPYLSTLIVTARRDGARGGKLG